MKQRLAAVALLSLALATAFGAFGAHSLKGMLSESAMETFKTAQQYQAWASVGLLAGSLLDRSRAEPWLWLVACGVLVFCASLYALSLGGPRILGVVAPVGGSLMILGWAGTAVAVLRGREEKEKPARYGE